MIEYAVYILYSKKYDRIYIGLTSNLTARFKSHNELGTKGYTKRYRLWEVIFVDFYKSKREAMSRERYLKSGVGRSWIHQYLI